MINALSRRNSDNLFHPLLAGPWGPLGAFDRDFMNDFFDPFRTITPEESVKSLDDGSVKLTYNLAGYDEKDVAVDFDSTTGELIIKAEGNDENGLRKFSMVRSLNPYVSADDLKVSLKNGLLSIVVAPLEKRKEEALVSLPIEGKALESGKSTKEKTE